MKSRSTFVRQAANLRQYKQELQQVLAHTVCVWLNRLFGLEPLQFDSLVTE
ncbi:hypothetical protein H6G35_35030 [Aulosira sp. FACHB-113]|nr:hypothetical protein [Aulosira sp. FACHB-113]